MTAVRSENRILDGAIVPTFFHFALSSVAGLLALTTASLVDGYFVGNFVGADALASITLLIPYFTLLFGAALMLAVGGVVSAGRALGKGEPEEASADFSKSLIATCVLSTAAMVLSSTWPNTLFTALGAPKALHPLMLEYFRVFSVVLVLQLGSMVLYYFVRLGGRPVLATAGLVCGAAGNILLDAVFVGYWGWGLAGAAWATGAAQLLQLAVLLIYFRDPDRQLRFSLRQRSWRSLISTAFNGVSEFINELSAGLVIFLLNWLLVARQGVEGVAAFTVTNYLIFLSLMLFYGIADAIHLLVSQNLGAGRDDRIRQFLRVAALVVLLLGCSLAAVLLFGRHYLAGLFLEPSDPSVTVLAAGYLAILWPLFLVNGLNVLMSVYLTAMHQPLPSALIALSRSLVLPVLILLAIAVWLPAWPLVAAIPLAEWLTFVFALLLVSRFRPGRLVQRQIAA
ncbi:MAG: multidrug transporter MatE [Alteromonadaceae bacterium]|nr:multidrug transporter MatE [Alteromonadaceae bacterium]|tara:strand:+ start:1136 stop:2497 length:1362 start_codon:yes stop_codon:yes gene_type:complete